MVGKWLEATFYSTSIFINAQNSAMSSPVSISQSVQRVLTGGHTRRDGGDLSRQQSQLELCKQAKVNLAKSQCLKKRA